MEILIIFILGLSIGSFLNCLIWRLHNKKSILGRSVCPKCKKKIVWYDNIPLVSFVLLRGKCRCCEKGISVQYPMVEVLTALLFLIVWYKHIGFADWQSVTQLLSYSVTQWCLVVRDWLFVVILIVIFVYDLRWYLILDKVTVPAMVVALALNLYLGFGWVNLLLAGVIGGGFFAIQYVISRGKWIGGGDIRLGALIGFMLSYPQVIVALMLAYLSGALVGIFLLATRKKKWSSQIPFGTFLSGATIVTLLWGDVILDWYLGLVK